MGSCAGIAGFTAGQGHAARGRAGDFQPLEPEFRRRLLGCNARRDRAGAGGRRHQRRAPLQTVPYPEPARARHVVHRDGPPAAVARFLEVPGYGRYIGDSRVAVRVDGRRDAGRKR